MPIKFPNIFDVDWNTDDSDNEKSIFDDSDDEKQPIKEDSANLVEETSENFASEDDDDEPDEEDDDEPDEEDDDKVSRDSDGDFDFDYEAESDLEPEPEVNIEAEIAKRKKKKEILKRPREDSEITDFREGYDKAIRSFEKRKFTSAEEDKALEDEIIAESQKKNRPSFYEEAMKFYFSKEMVKKREQKILKDFESQWDIDWFDFPVDPEKWSEKDNREIWSDRPAGATRPGFDPKWPDWKDVEAVRDSIRAGMDPNIGPFYVPYRKTDPPVTDIIPDFRSPKQVIEELDMVEEFMKWSSCVFVDGSSYEGTVWDDGAQGKGVYISPQGLVRYEGEWFRNQMEGHGVTEVEVPEYQPVPGSQHEAEMRAKGEIITRDFMSPDDRKWLEMDIEDSVQVGRTKFSVPFYENKLWLKIFKNKPEKGRYRYAGQWKHGRMHGCGVYESNERVLHGRFYFGEFVGINDCDSNISAMHAGLAEVAAAKARMFMNKPEGMVREDLGPYNDPQHPCFYEEDDAWMAPGFVSQFYEVPDYWKAYVDDVDEEREMWLNSFYKAPLRLPMPAELEHWWSKDEAPEFVLVKGEPEPDPEDPSKLIEPDPFIVHTPTKRLISFMDDEEHGIRLFWQPLEGEEPVEGEEEEEEEEEEENEGDGDGDGEEVKFLPYEDELTREKYTVERRSDNPVINAILDVCNSAERWIEKKKKASNKRKNILEKKVDLVEAEITLREAIEDEDEELVRLQKEEMKKLKESVIEEEDVVIPFEETSQLDEKVSAIEDEIKKVKVSVKEEEKEVKKEEEEKDLEDPEEEEEEEEEEEDDEVTPTSFGSIIDDQDSTKSDQDGKKNGRSPFASLSLPFASLVSVPSQLQLSFSKWKNLKLPPKISPPSSSSSSSSSSPPSSSSPSPSHSCMVSLDQQMSLLYSVSFPRTVDQGLTLRSGRHAHHQGKHINITRMRNHTRHKAYAKLPRKTADLKPGSWIWPAIDQGEKLNILSLHTLL